MELVVFSFCCIVISAVLPVCFGEITNDTLTSDHPLIDGWTMVSANQQFEFGFCSPGKYNHRYLGIWYKGLPLTVVWVANRNDPITDFSGKLFVTTEGKLLLKNLNSLVWSFSPSAGPAKKAILQILDTGNLVLRDASFDDSRLYLWQSFDYPTNTLLAGMGLGRNRITGAELHLTSWKTSHDPSSGRYTFALENPNSPQLILRKGFEKEYRCGPWDGSEFFGSSEWRTHPIYEPVFTSNAEEISYSFKIQNKPFLLRLYLDDQGIVQYLMWRNHSNDWISIMKFKSDQCDSYATCGPYASCYNGDPTCRCLHGFVPKYAEDWNLMDWSGGCTRYWKLNCKEGDGFVKYDGLKLPDCSNVITIESLSHKDCEIECLQNCSCTAYAILKRYVNGSTCVLWYGDLMDMRSLPEHGGTIYIRMAQEEIDFIAEQKRREESKKIIIIFFPTVAGLLLLSFAAWGGLRLMKRIRKVMSLADQQRDTPVNTDETGIFDEDLKLPYFDFATMSAATDNFSEENKAGAGGFGSVYKGVLPDGREIAVKRLANRGGQGLREFENEAKVIANLHHRNLVHLLGCCIEQNERMLVYEYMSNRSLDKILFDPSKVNVLTWKKRFDIILGIARGLLYLHQDSRTKIIHRDLKTSNILLDADMVPKISDFGVARTFDDEQSQGSSENVIGTHGYMSPEYVQHGVFSVKLDVFSFGVIVLEIVSGKKNRRFNHPDHNLNLIGHAWTLLNEGRALELLDERMEGSICLEQSLRCIQVGLLCVQELPEDRPTMLSVTMMLSDERSDIPTPNEPGFYGDGFLPPGRRQNPSNAQELTVTVEARVTNPGRFCFKG